MREGSSSDFLKPVIELLSCAGTQHLSNLLDQFIGQIDLWMKLPKLRERFLFFGLQFFRPTKKQGGEVSITVVLYNGSTEQGQLIGTSASHDLAVVRITPYANMVVAQFGNSSQLVVGQDVIAIGNPLGITETATEGIVSALGRTVPKSSSVTISNAIQTDAAVNPGNSGGALINVQGQVVGITFASAAYSQTNTAADGVNFAIPSNLVQTVVQQILQQNNA